MTAYDKVIDKYWIDYLIAKSFLQTSESLHAPFWNWFYKDLCESSRQLAQQKWDEAQE